MKRLKNITVAVLMVLLAAISACNSGSGDDSKASSDDIYDASGNWNLDSNLISPMCGSFVVPLYGEIIIVVNDDDTFVMSLENTDLVVKGTKDGNTFKCTTVGYEGIDYNNMVTGSFTLDSDSSFSGTVTITYEECQQVFDVTGSR